MARVPLKPMLDMAKKAMAEDYMSLSNADRAAVMEAHEKLPDRIRKRLKVYGLANLSTAIKKHLDIGDKARSIDLAKQACIITSPQVVKEEDGMALVAFIPASVVELDTEHCVLLPKGAVINENQGGDSDGPDCPGG